MNGVVLVFVCLAPSLLIESTEIKLKFPKDIPCVFDWVCRKFGKDFCLDKKCYKKKAHAEDCSVTRQCPDGMQCRKIETDSRIGVCSCKSQERWLNGTCINQNACFTDGDCQLGSCVFYTNSDYGFCKSNQIKGVIKGVVAVLGVCVFIGIMSYIVVRMVKRSQQLRDNEIVIANQCDSCSGYGSTSVTTVVSVTPVVMNGEKSSSLFSTSASTSPTVPV
jgi:hypothetical protein